MEKLPHWSEIVFCEEGICERGHRKLKKFRTSQAAWDAWDDANEMLWCLTRRWYDNRHLVRCGMELVQPVTPILHESLTRTELFVQAMDVIRDWQKRPTQENKDRVASYLQQMKRGLEEKRIPYNAANCVFKLGRCIYRKNIIEELGIEVAFALIYAAKYRPAERRLIPEIPNDELSLKRIAEYQCGIVRRHFPTAPTSISFD